MSEQMEFGDVVESERMVGDRSYTQWIKDGRPTLTVDEWLEMEKPGWRPVEDVIPGL